LGKDGSVGIKEGGKIDKGPILGFSIELNNEYLVKHPERINSVGNNERT